MPSLALPGRFHSFIFLMNLKKRGELQSSIPFYSLPSDKPKKKDKAMNTTLGIVFSHLTTCVDRKPILWSIPWRSKRPLKGNLWLWLDGYQPYFPNQFPKQDIDKKIVIIEFRDGALWASLWG